jgi:hypothetical protein
MMDFPMLLQEFTAAVETRDGKRLGALFTADGVYHDTFYGEFRGAAAIADMLENRFWRDAEAFRWTMRHPLCDGRQGYAEWTFSYTSKMPESRGVRVVCEGMSRFELENGRIRRYGEIFEGALALSQLGFAAERIAKVLRKWSDQKRALPQAATHLKAQ